MRIYAFCKITKSDEKKNGATNFKIGKFASFNMWKKEQQKNGAWNFKIGKYAFLIFEKEMSKKIAPVI